MHPAYVQKRVHAPCRREILAAARDLTRAGIDQQNTPTLRGWRWTPCNVLR